MSKRSSSGSLGTKNLTALRLSTNTVPLYLVGSNDYTDDSETFTHEFRLTGSWADSTMSVACTT